MSIGQKILIVLVIIVVLKLIFNFFKVVPTRGRIISKSEEDTSRWDYFPEDRVITIQDDFGNQRKITLSRISEEGWNDLRIGSEYDEYAPKDEG